MPRFVVLEHHWNGVHWDVMFETSDVLQTWAVDSPIVPGKLLAARKLPDHRKEYLDYEGEVSGGRGTVRRVDGGAYNARVWTGTRVVVKLAGSQLVGVLELRRSGEGAIETPDRSWSLRLGNLD